MDITTDRERPDRAVLVGVDGTTLALDAVRWAAAEATLRGRTLQILHAAPYAEETNRPGRRRAKEILARAYTVARRTQPGLATSTTLTVAAPARALLQTADGAELVVVGMGGGDRPHEILIGSTALDVCGTAPCPVVVVRGRRRGQSDTRPVLVGVDTPTADAAALTVAFNDAQRHRSELVIVHARHGAVPARNRLTGRSQTARSADWNQLADALRPWAARFPDVPVELEVIQGHPTAVLLGAAVRARLLVLSTRGRSAPARALFGSTSREVLRRCPVPVEVVNPAIVIDTGDPATTGTVHRDPGSLVPDRASDDPHDPSQLW